MFSTKILCPGNSPMFADEIVIFYKPENNGIPISDLVDTLNSSLVQTQRYIRQYLILFNIYVYYVHMYIYTIVHLPLVP